MRKTRRNYNGFFFRYATIALVFVFLFSVVLLIISLCEKKHSFFPVSDVEEELVEFNGQKYTLRDDIESFLVMGLDKFEDYSHNDSYNNDQQADFLLLFVFDKKAKKCSAIHINRDTMVDMNVLGVAGQKVDTVNKQIALAHTYGNGREVSCRNTADAVSKLLLDVKINHYISFTMESVPLLNDLVGGVEVEILDDFSGIDDTLIIGKKVTLFGEQALKYVRTRYGLEDSSNSTRMIRQKQYMQALYEKLQLCINNDSEFIVDASLKMSDYIVSDRSITQLQDIAKKITD